MAELVNESIIADMEDPQVIVISLSDDSAKKEPGNVKPYYKEGQVLRAISIFGDGSEEVESPIILENKIEVLIKVLATQNDTVIDITSNVVISEDGQSLSFDGAYSKLEVTYDYIYHEGAVVDDNDDVIVEDPIIFDEEMRDQLSYLYSLFKNLDETQIQTLASNLENATIGNSSISLQTEQEIADFLTCLDDLVVDDAVLSQEKIDIENTLEASFNKDITDYAYLVPISVEDTKSDIIDALNEELTDETLAILEAAYDDSVDAVHGNINMDTVNDFIENLVPQIDSTFTEEQINVILAAINDQIYNRHVEHDIRVEIIRDDLLGLLGDNKKVNAALASIIESVDKINNTRTTTSVWQDIFDFLESNEIPQSDIDTIQESYNANIAPIISIDRIHGMLEAFVNDISGISSLQERVASSDIIVNGGSVIPSPVTLKESVLSVTEVSGRKSDGTVEDITSTVTVSDGVITLPEDSYIYLYAAYQTTILDKIKLIILEAAQSDNVSFNLQVAKDAITGDILEYELSQRITSGELDILKAAFTQAFGDEITLNTLNAKLGIFDRIIAKSVSVDQLTAAKATIREATIDTLYVNTLNAKLAIIREAIIEYADIQYAKINFANIDEAAVRNLFVNVGMIKDLRFVDGHWTGTLSGMTVVCDLVQANTIVVGDLLVRDRENEDVYYRLNVEESGVTREELEALDYEKYIRGSDIVAKTVTAEKILVDDLVALQATIGGFEIDSSSIHTKNKESATSVVEGIFLGSDTVESRLNTAIKSTFVEVINEQYNEKAGFTTITISATIQMPPNVKRITDFSSPIEDGPTYIYVHYFHKEGFPNWIGMQHLPEHLVSWEPYNEEWGGPKSYSYNPKTNKLTVEIEFNEFLRPDTEYDFTRPDSVTINHIGVLVSGDTAQLGVGSLNGNHIIYTGSGIDIKTDWMEFDDESKTLRIGAENSDQTIIGNDAFVLTNKYGNTDLIIDKRDLQRNYDKEILVSDKPYISLDQAGSASFTTNGIPLGGKSIFAVVREVDTSIVEEQYVDYFYRYSFGEPIEISLRETPVAASNISLSGEAREHSVLMYHWNLDFTYGVAEMKSFRDVVIDYDGEVTFTMNPRASSAANTYSIFEATYNYMAQQNEEVSSAVSLVSGTPLSKTLADDCSYLWISYDGDREITIYNEAPSGLDVVCSLEFVSYYSFVKTPNFTFGSRRFSEGGFTFSAGEGLGVASDYQAVFGRFNSREENALFIIGDGDNLQDTTNSLEVHRDGHLKLAAYYWDEDPYSGHMMSGEDASLYNALLDLGWLSEVISEVIYQ